MLITFQVLGNFMLLVAPVFDSAAVEHSIVTGLDSAILWHLS